MKIHIVAVLVGTKKAVLYKSYCISFNLYNFKYIIYLVLNLPIGSETLFL